MLCAVVVTASMAAPVRPAVQQYEGYAYAVSDGKLLYRESHWAYTEGGAQQKLILYRCADGKPFARKRIDAIPGEAIPDFEMIDARNCYREGVRTSHGHR